VKNSAAPVPFAWVFDGAGRLALNFAGTSSLQLFTVNEDNTITAAGAPVSDTRAALCWVTPAAGYVYGSNTGSDDISQFEVAGGVVTLVNPIAASNIRGAVDSAAVGGFLYVQAGLEGTVHVFGIGAGGALTPVQVAEARKVSPLRSLRMRGGAGAPPLSTYGPTRATRRCRRSPAARTAPPAAVRRPG